MEYINRHAESMLEQYISQFPVVTLTGPRQSGKSTLLRHFGGEKWNYINMDNRNISAAARRDPDLFIKDIKSNTIIDEAQKSTEIFHSIKERVEKDRKIKFILSGSANFLLFKKVTETLAGRVAVMELLPFSKSEIEGIKNPLFLKAIIKNNKKDDLIRLMQNIKLNREEDIMRYLLNGGFPPIIKLSDDDKKALWFENYRTTYLERDLRDLAQVGNLDDFQRFYQLIAFQTGQIMNLSSLSREIGITVATCRKYINILETSYQAIRLFPFHVNIRKRLVKLPKIYFVDTGLSNYFMQYKSYNELMNSGKMGSIFETWVIMEIIKILNYCVPKPKYYFWKSYNGAEVDLIINFANKLIPIEIKHAARIEKRNLLGMENFMNDVRNMDIPFGLFIYRGNEIVSLTENIIAVPLEYIWH